jgi:exocyst complex component 7
MCPTTSTPATGDVDTDAAVLAKLRVSRAAIISVLAATAEAEVDIVDEAGDQLAELMSSSSPSTSHLQSQGVAMKALRTRIDRAVAPASPLLAAFRGVSALAEDAAPRADPADTESAATFVCGDEAVRRVEEAVGFLGRTKAAGRARVRGGG